MIDGEVAIYIFIVIGDMDKYKKAWLFLKTSVS